jgi:hypothetical protein
MVIGLMGFKVVVLWKRRSVATQDPSNHHLAGLEDIIDSGMALSTESLQLRHIGELFTKVHTLPSPPRY